MKRGNFRRTLWIVFLCSLLLLPGCWSRKELSEITFVIGASIGKGPEGKGIKVITQTARVDVLATTSKSDTPAFVNFEKTGRTVFDAVRNITLESPLKLFWGHQQMLLITEEMAKDGFTEAINFFARDHETSRHVMMAIIEGDEEAFMYTQTSKQEIPLMSLRTMIRDYISNGKLIPVEVHDYLRADSTPGICYVVPLVRMQVKEGVPHYEMSGTALFANDKMSDKLTADQTRGLVWLLNMMDSTVIPVNVTATARNNPEEFQADEMSIEVLNAKTKIKALGNMQFEVNTKVQVSLGEENLRENFARDEYKHLTEMVQEQVAKIIEQEMQEVVKITKKVGTDPGGFGRALYRQRPDEWRQLRGDWCGGVYPDINVKYNVTVELVGGMLLRDMDAH